MADKKISALTAATTPLAGTEVLPIVQSGATVKVAVSNLTAGRAVSATSIATGLGAVTTPAYTFTGNTNTGMWSPGADTVAISTNNGERVRITSVGNFGVGTSAPTYQTQVAGIGQLTANLTDAGVKGASLFLQAQDANGGAGGALLFGTNAANGTPFSAIKSLLTNGSSNTLGDLAISTRDAASDTALTERMRIAAAGNVGINEAAPDYRLDVNGTFGFTPGASVTPVDNGDVVFELTNNTTLTVKAKGSDGTVRSGTIILV